MVAEIEKPVVSFTEEAEGALRRTITRFERRLRARAADEAIKSRGTPAEVTSSDIEKAYRRLMDVRSTGDPFEERYRSYRRWQSRRSMFQVLSSAYIITGVVLGCAGLVYPFVRAQLQNPSLRQSALFALAGFVMAALGALLRFYVRQRDFMQRSDDWRRYYTDVHERLRGSIDKPFV